MIKYFFLLSLITSSLQALDEMELAKRVKAHLQINDIRSASKEARVAIKRFPQSKELIEVYIEALAAEGSDREMFRAWDHYQKIVPEAYAERTLLETISWGVIKKGAKSPSPLVRLIATLGAYFGQDSKGVLLLQKSLHDYDQMVREVALELSSSMRDELLRKEVLRLFRSEQPWAIKIRLIQAVGKMKIKEALPDLMELIKRERGGKEVCLAAVEAVASMHDKPRRNEIASLVNSPYAGNRQLGCQFVIVSNVKESLDLIVPLLHDTHADVRSVAALTLGLLRPQEIDGKSILEFIRPLINDQNEQVAIIAAWLMTIYQPEEGQKYFSSWLNHPNRLTRIFASSALAATGKYGLPFMEQAFHEADDPYVKMNLAMALIAQKKCVQESCRAIHASVVSRKEKWMWKELGIFRAVAPSNIKRSAAVPQLPESTDQLVRLEILNTLVIAQDKDAKETIKTFLEKQQWGVSAAASAVLLMEGDEEAIILVEQLLEDLNPKIRVQAALILALWGEGERALRVLIDSYPQADKNMKERIIEAVGQIGDEKGLPFLVQCMKEQRQTVRIIAAASLLRALYH